MGTALWLAKSLCYTSMAQVNNYALRGKRMTTAALREQLRQQVDVLPDEIIVEIADFTAFVLARRQIPLQYAEWHLTQWREFALGQFLRETDDDVEYTLEDAKEVYHQ